MTANANIAPVLQALNSAYRCDAFAVKQILENSIPCNLTLANHTCVVVSEDNRLSALGLINGVLTAVGLPKVAAVYDDNKQLIGFEEYKT